MATLSIRQPVVCEIDAISSLARDYEAIVRTCAGDVAQAVRIRRLPGATSARTAITLRLPASMAASQHPIWCLACRLACFCPRARVSVLVSGTDFGRRPRVAAAQAA